MIDRYITESLDAITQVGYFIRDTKINEVICSCIDPSYCKLICKLLNEDSNP